MGVGDAADRAALAFLAAGVLAVVLLVRVVL
jgi:hypothetical protein